MTRDVVGTRAKFGVVIPMTNVVCESDYPMLAVPGVTFHYGRATFSVPEFKDDSAFDALIKSIHDGTEAAIERIMAARPDYMICGMSAETFWHGAEGNAAFEKQVAEWCGGGLGVTTGARATSEALSLYGAKRIGIVCPYPNVGIGHVRQFFGDSGFEIADIHGFACETPAAMCQLDDADLRPVLDRFLDQGVDAIVQAGTNVSMVRLAAAVEKHADIPVIPINAACVWHAYRAMGIKDQFTGHGRLFEEL